MLRGKDQIYAIDKAEDIWGEPLDVHRANLRAPFRTEQGKALLAKLMKKGGVLDQVSPENLAVHNYTVELLEEMGFLDEAFLPRLVEFFLSLPTHEDRATLAKEYLDGKRDER